MYSYKKDSFVDNIRSNSSSKQNTLPYRVFEKIKEEIVTGNIPQGSKIGEAELAKSYNISRGPLREALNRLEYMSLIKKTPHAGSRVITLGLEMMREVYQVREAMEGFATRLAVETMKQNEIDYLYRLLEKHEKSIEEVGGKIYFQKEGDLDFHYYLFSKSKNQRLIDYLHNKLYQLLRMCRYRTSQIQYRPEVALREHYSIVDAINSRDAEFAEILMRRHIQGAWKSIEGMSVSKENICLDSNQTKNKEKS